MKSFAMIFGLALAVLGTAVSSSSSKAPIAQSNFSFASWIDSVVADPSKILSPEEAVASFNNELASLSTIPTFDTCRTHKRLKQAFKPSQKSKKHSFKASAKATSKKRAIVRPTAGGEPQGAVAGAPAVQSQRGRVINTPRQYL
jgi:hypothetical protein